MSARELADLTPTAADVAWARQLSRTDEHLLVLVLALRCFGRLGYFPRSEDVPAAVVDHVCRCLELEDGTAAVCGPATAKLHRTLVRERLGVVCDPQRARAVAQDAIAGAALVKNHPPDLINVALELLVKASLELPGFATLDELAARIRHDVNSAMFERVGARIALPDRIALEGLLDVAGPGAKSAFHRLKRAAGRASWSAFREQVAHLRWVDSLGDTDAWLEGIAESKIADFAGEAMAADAGVMRDVAPAKRMALLGCMVHVARTRARDDLAAMFCKRVASITKLAKAELGEIRERQAEMSERLITNYRGVLACLDPRSDSDASQALRLARKTVEQAGGFDAQLADIEAVAAHHANNYMPLVARHRRRDRATMFAFARVVELEATSADRSVLDAVEHALSHAHLIRDHIPNHVDGTMLDVSFASEQWQRIIRDREHPGRLNRRHFEACVFTYLAAELRSGDIAVRGSEAYANWSARLLPREDCEELLGEFCAQAGLPTSAEAFTSALRSRLTEQAATVDAGYPENTDLVIDEVTGVPSLRRRRGGKDRDCEALLLEQAVRQRMPERTLLEILARTAYWLEWWRRFGPASGSDPKLADPLLRYVLTTFTYGANMGPAQAARHIRGVSAHELGATAARHFTTAKLNRASADVVNAYLQLDLVNAWGDATSVAADGTQVDTLIDNLLAESHIRYGGYGGIAYHHVADNYIALFSHFIPCGVWEAVYIIEGLLKNESEAEPGTIHADTQGQSYPVHALAHLFGFELLTRIRNWKDLTFYRPTADVSYAHIDALFGPAGENAINWQLIQTHWSDLMQIALSIRAGRLSSTLLLRRLGTESRKNNIYKAFRELGRVIRTITLLRFVSEPGLRQEITAATNKAEAFNGFSAWLRFGHDAIERNDPAEQEKIIKFNTLLANCVIFHTALDMTAVLRELAAEGWDLTPAAVGSLSPYITEPIKRFGEYATDGLTIPPAAFDARLNLPPRSGDMVSSAGMAA